MDRGSDLTVMRLATSVSRGWAALAVVLALCGGHLVSAAGSGSAASGVWVPRDALVRVSLQTERQGVMVKGRFVADAKVLEVAEFDGVLLGREGLVVSFVGEYVHVLDLDAVRATLRTLEGRTTQARTLGVDERLSLLFLEQERGNATAGLRISRREAVEHFKMAKIVDNRLRLASPCVQSRSDRSWLPVEEWVVSGLRLTEPGWQGATCVDLEGDLLGIMVAAGRHRSSSRWARGELLPASRIAESLETIRGGVRRIPAGWLGVFLEPAPGGARVGELHEGGPGQRAGLVPGDVIEALDGNLFRDRMDLARALRWKGPGSASQLRVRRGTRVLDLLATLQTRTHRHQTAWEVVVDAGSGRGEPVLEMHRTALPALVELGFDAVQLEPRQAAKRGSPTRGGLLVEGVAAGSSAQRAGFQPGDVIFRINGKDVFSLADVKSCLQTAGGGTLTIRLVRGGRVLSQKISLE